MASTTETFQISTDIAEMYESRFVPRLFEPWARQLVGLAEVKPGQRVLDVACGTGVVAREASIRMRGEGAIAGLDLNPNMLSVARRLQPDLEWRQGDAASLPFSADSFDVVLCQAALMFMPDPARALGEMARVVSARGTVAVQVWDRLEAQPAHAPFVAVAARHAGPEAIRLLSSYWVLGDRTQLVALLEAAGLEVLDVVTRVEMARFDSIDELVRTEVESTPLVERISAEVYRDILNDSRDALKSFVIESGEADIPLSGHILRARRR
jgi:ubiquinone/menaquinone biosynthesis C-methylase UbiE